MSEPELNEALRAAVTERFETAQVPWLTELVEAPSATREPEDVEAAAALIDEKAAGLGLEAERVPDPEGRFADHRVYTSRAARAAEKALALVGHVDTVFPRSMGFFGLKRDGDVIRGPGVLDMKSGLSAIVFALEALRSVAPSRFEALPVRFICVSDEEVGSPSSAALYRELAPLTAAALVFEAGREEDRIITERKGGAFFRLETHGVAAHAGNHHRDGANAIHAMARLVPRIEALTDYARGLTVSVGTFRGGTAKNTVPDHAVIEVDGRFIEPEDGPALEAAFAALVADPYGENPPAGLGPVRFELGGGVSRPPMRASDESEALRLRYERHAAATGLSIGRAPLQGGGSDANLLSAAGVPTIDGLGPYGRHFHRRDEWSSLESLRRRTQALATFLAEASDPGALSPPSA